MNRQPKVSCDFCLSSCERGTPRTADWGPESVRGCETDGMWSPEWPLVANSSHWLDRSLIIGLDVDPNIWIWFAPGSSSKVTLTLGTRSFFIARTHPVHCRMFSNIPGLCSLDTGTYPCSVVTSNNVSRQCRVSPKEEWG